MARGTRDVTRDRAVAAGASDGAVLSLDDARARAPARAGAKAAALAIARANGLPVLPGFVVTDAAAPRAARSSWDALSDGGNVPLAVRSSSVVEDQAAASMAGQFTTVLDVRGWEGAIDAIAAVRASAGGAPMSVLVQPMCDARRGGVLFGADPVSGRTDRLVVEHVAGRPSALVSGEVSAAREVLTRRGRLVDASAVALDRRDARRLAQLARAAASVFGGPQDIEWAIDTAGRLWLLQSRPITFLARRPTGPVFGPAPVAETFPDPLSPLELDLWAEPVRVAIAAALRLAAAQPRRAIESSPVLVDVGGRVAVDLGLVEGRAPGGRRRLHRLAAAVDPRPGARRFLASWRVGRLRRALPLLARDVVGEIDASLAAVPRVGHLGDGDLLALLGRTRLALRSLHAHEVLAGVLLAGDGATAIEHALAAVRAGRAAGIDDGGIAMRSPVALALSAPRIGATAMLPEVAGALGGGSEPRELGAREALRLRTRWVQELSARAAAELGARLAATGRIDEAADVRWLALDELVTMVRDGAQAPVDLWVRRACEPPAPLPAAFRLADDGTVVALGTGATTAGRGAGGGRGAGPVAAPGDNPAGTVLVVSTLDPRLAATLPGRAGLVAETGSVLSHLAIVARELGVPTVVGVAGAIQRFPPGTRVVVDGTTGAVEVLA